MNDVSHEYAPVQRKLLALSKSLTWAHMGREAGLSPQTIKRFAHNETASPQYRTVSLLADYAGFRMSIVDLRINTVLPLRRIK